MRARLFLAAVWLFFLVLSWSLLPILPAFIFNFLSFSLLVLLTRYADKLLLHFLQARELSESHYSRFYQIARAETYKLRLPVPQLYFYQGHFDRAFCFFLRGRLTFVIERKLLQIKSDSDLKSLFLMLAIQAKDKTAIKSTFSLVCAGVLWMLPAKILGLKKGKNFFFKEVIHWLFFPIVHQIYLFLMPRSSFKSIIESLKKNETSYTSILTLNSTLYQPRLDLTISRFCSYNYFSLSHQESEKMVLIIECLSHPMDQLYPEKAGPCYA